MSVYVWLFDGEVLGVGSTAESALQSGVSVLRDCSNATARGMTRNPNAIWPEKQIEQAKSVGKTVKFTAEGTDEEKAAADTALLALFAVPVQDAGHGVETGVTNQPAANGSAPAAQPGA